VILTRKADHPIPFSNRANALLRLSFLSIVPRILVMLGNLSKLCVQFRGLNMILAYALPSVRPEAVLIERVDVYRVAYVVFGAKICIISI
jgi:hypothetical protein